MTTYAIADKVPDDCDYLTAGKEYEVVAEDVLCFFFICDDGFEVWSSWVGACCLSGGNWRRVEK